MLYGAIVSYLACLAFFKLAVLWQYVRLFVRKTFQRVCYGVMILVAIYHTLSINLSLFKCKPIALFWDDNLHGSCLNSQALWFTNSAINVATDLTIFFLPIPVLMKLQLPKAKKFILISMFAFGAL